MTNLIRWLRAVSTWLSEARYAWLALSAVAVTAFAICAAGNTEQAIRLGGMALQLLGVGTVAWGISETRASFGHTPLLVVALSWLRHFPHCGPRVVTASSNVTMAPMTGCAYGSVSPAASSDQSIEGRLASLEQQQADLRTTISNLHVALDQEIRKTANQIAEESKIRDMAITGVRKRLETTATGGIHITAVGAVWLFVGVILGSASPELASLAHH